MRAWAVLLAAGWVAGLAVPTTLAAPAGQGEAALLADLATSSGQPAALLPGPTPAPGGPPRLPLAPVRIVSTETPRELEPVVEAAATSAGVDVNFFKRLIRQESGFNPNAISHAGAQGIAQFMPGTAALVGLDDPFDPRKALPKSAELISSLHQRLGNEGLAAAAYNAGEGRVRAWLAGRSSLPVETQNYVAAITGRSVTEWVRPGMAAASLGTLKLAGVAGPGFDRVQSAEWRFGLQLLGGAGARLGTLIEDASRSARRQPAGRPRAAIASAVSRGEKGLCESLKASGCIVARVY
jgi:soluble lytic murein transglycosylase-like protein